MKTPLNWLSDYVGLDVTPKEFADGMTMSGSKVETVDYVGEGCKKVVVGRLISVAPHPDSDHLQICMTDVGGERPLQIITGAQNVAAGDYVPVALDGSELPGGQKIKAGKLRGMLSEGMLCSIGELGLTEHDVPYAIADGILIFDRPWPLGTDICKVFGFDDYVVDFEITSNRPDCLSVLGIAREAAATFKKELKMPPTECKNEDRDDDINRYISVEVTDGELCPRYIARCVKNVKIAPSPDWMRQRLAKAGVRPINNIVDITNYVMLEYGQPMHAFDQSSVGGHRIIVRRANEGETLVTLDEIERRLDPSMLVICDDKQPTAVAGVMGGDFSGITDTTDTIIFESANFFGPSVRITSKKLGLRTEASSRFEKGLDPEMTLAAVNRACELVEELECGTVVGGMIDVDSSSHQRRVLKLEPGKTNRFLGTDIKRGDMVAMLLSLGFEVSGDDITVPSWRADVEGFADVAEEIARLYGYNNIPTTLITAETTQGMRTESQKATKRAVSALLNQGMYEISTFTFISPRSYDKILLAADSPLRRCVTITNPLGEDTSVMRTTTMPSMMEALATNYSYRNESAALCELGRIYLPHESANELPDEKDILTLGMYGGCDYFSLKGKVEAVFDEMGITSYDIEPEKNDPSFHPGRCARITVGGEPLAILGQVHPEAAANYGIGGECYVAMIDFETLLKNSCSEKQYKPLPRYPAVTRDLAVLCDAALPVAHIEHLIRARSGRLLEQLTLFDVYQGKQVPEGKKSVAYSLILRDENKTLAEEDIDRVISKVILSLKEELGAILRE